MILLFVHYITLPNWIAPLRDIPLYDYDYAHLMFLFLLLSIWDCCAGSVLTFHHVARNHLTLVTSPLRLAWLVGALSS